MEVMLSSAVHAELLVERTFCCLAQVELFCISKLINCLLDADEEFVYMDCHFAIGEHEHALVVCAMQSRPVFSYIKAACN